MGGDIVQSAFDLQYNACIQNTNGCVPFVAMYIVNRLCEFFMRIKILLLYNEIVRLSL